MLGKLRPLRVLQIVVKIFRLPFHLGHLLRVFVEDVLSNEIGPFELLPAERAQPLVLRQLLGVGLNEFFHLADSRVKETMGVMEMSLFSRTLEKD